MVICDINQWNVIVLSTLHIIMIIELVFEAEAFVADFEGLGVSLCKINTLERVRSV